MEELVAIKYIENRSRFFAHLYKIDESSDVEEILKKHRKLYKKANHHCYALVLSDDTSFKNDGEVGHPGQVLLEILKKENLSSHCLMVSRIFGGIKLGVGGVSRAFKEAGNAAVSELHH
jgi:putative IMPACT (imprinted ancient) family translation regulator